MSVLANLAEIGLQGFIDVYRQVQEEHPEQTEPFKPSELRKLMWARMAANESGMEKKSFKIPYENLKKTKLQFPYMPNDIRYTGCCAIKKNGDLYTPCCAKTKDSYCLSCTVDKDGNAKDLPYGSVEDREQNIADGKFTPITYGTWLKKAKKTIDQVYGVLGENGISLVISAEELETRETPKNRKGRPAKSDDSAGSKGSKKSKTPEPEPEEEDGYSSAASSISTKSSQGSKSKKSKAPEPEPEDDAEPEPVKAKKSKKPKAPEPEDEAPVKAKKSKKPKAPEPEDEAPVKAKKSKKPKAEPDEAPEPVKAKKSKKPKDDEPAPVKPKKEKKEKAEKAEKPKKAEKAEKAKPKAEPEESDDERIGSMELQVEEEEVEEETRIINGKKYMRTGDSAVIYDGRGTVVGSVNEDGEWMDSAGEEMVDEEAEFSEDD